MSQSHAPDPDCPPVSPTENELRILNEKITQILQISEHRSHAENSALPLSVDSHDCPCRCCAVRRTTVARHRRHWLTALETACGAIALLFGVVGTVAVFNGTSLAGSPHVGVGMFFLVALGFIDNFRRKG